jgi:hypothetical protein
MKTSLCCVLLLLASTVSGSSLIASDVNLVAGTLIQCTVNEPNFSTNTVGVEEPLVCYARPIRIFACYGALAGSQLSGRVADLKQPGHFFGKGWMKIEFDRLVLPSTITPISAKVIAIQGAKVDAKGKMLGKGHPVRDAAEWAVPVLWPEKVLTLPRRGPAPGLHGERDVTLRLMDDIRVPCSESADTGLRRFGPQSRNDPAPALDWRAFNAWDAFSAFTSTWAGR